MLNNIFNTTSRSGFPLESRSSYILRNNGGGENLMDMEKIENVLKPALLLDLDALDRNCQVIAMHAKGKKIRVATKSIRSIEVIKRILASNECYQGIMTYSADESLVLVKYGFNDILLGYPSMDENSLKLIAREHPKEITVMVDSLAHVDYLIKLAKSVNGQFSVCIDIDMSTNIFGFHFGVRRSSLRSSSEVLAIVEAIHASDVLHWKGLMGYEAQIAGVGDNVPHSYGKNTIIRLMKQKAKREVKRKREEIITALQQKGYTPALVNGGGTGSIHYTATDEQVSEITVGSGFYSPLLFDYYQEIKYEPALFFAIPIVRQAKANIYTCLGGGYIASGVTDQTKMPHPVYPHGMRLLSMEGAGEVQTPLSYSKERLSIGSAVVFRAAKAGEVCERFTEIHCYSENQSTSTVKTYRGEGMCFL
ncbi:alanine racemase [Cytobacillus kochii]|uniref:alanine racemase n=1 Tax=Cytobacillus kochii TaxID=859143 RepID=UPI00402AB1F4